MTSADLKTIETRMVDTKQIDKAPKFNFAIFSKRDGQFTAEIESSFADETTAKGMFERQYMTWGFDDTTFYLVDWAEQRVIRKFKFERQTS